MDTITQVILGAVIAEAGFRHRLGGKGLAMGAFCGLFPDLDMVVRIFGRWAMFEHHRGVSHSFLFLMIMAPLLGWVGYLWNKREARYLLWWHLAFWALITHVFLDICTSYGTQIFSPLSARRFALDAVSVMDPLYTLPLLLALILGCFPRLSQNFRRRFAIAMLAFTTAYLSLGYYQSRRAVAIASRQLEDFAATEIRAIPTLFNIWLWRIVARDDEGNLRVGMLSTLRPQKISFESLPRPQDPLLSATLESEKGEIFNWFAMGMVNARVERDKQGTKVYLYDQRYGLVTAPTSSIFAACAKFDRFGHLREFQLIERPHSFKIKDELAMQWYMLWGSDSR